MTEQVHFTCVTVSRSTDFDGSLIDIIAELQSVLKSIPEEYRSTAYVCVEEGQHTYSESTYPIQIIRYTRPENEAEAADRIEKERIRLARQELREREEFERLAAKFKETP